MLARLKSHFAAPAPPLSHAPLVEAVYYAVAVYAILVLMRPFGIDDDSSAFTLLPYAAITYIGVLLPYAAIRLCRPSFFSAGRWTNGRDAVLLCLVVLCIAAGNICYTAAATGQLTIGLCVNMLWQTAAIAVGVSGIKLYRRNRLLQRHLREAQEFNASLQRMADRSSAPVDMPITLEGTGKKDACRVSADRLLYVESERNYCKIVYIGDDGRAACASIRATLASVSEQLAEHDNIVRVHRAFLVNLHRVDEVEGNAAGCRLMLCGGKVVVPVARSYASTIMKQLRK